MPTPEQIESVAQAMWERDLLSGSVPYEKDVRDDYRNTARVAIDAYESTRPAVASDEALTFEDISSAYWEAFNRTTGEIMAARTRTATKDDLRQERRTSNAVGIRAVRDRINNHKEG